MRTTTSRFTKRLAAAFILVSLLLAACGGDDTSDDGGSSSSGETSSDESGPTTPTGVLRYAPTTLVQTFDPARVQNAQLYYLQPVYDTLLRLGDDDEVQPGLAEEWDWDGTTATLTLREGATFAGGTTPIDSTVVQANLERFLQVGGPQKAGIATLATVEAPDPQTVVLTFSGPSPTLLTELAQAPGMIMDPAEFDNPDLATKPAGMSGPYILDPSTGAGGDRYVFTINESYWDPSVQATERIEIVPMPDSAARANALEAGEVDVTSVDYAQVDQIAASGFENSTRPGALWFTMILDRGGKLQPALADPKVRQALSLAIDREAVIEGVFFGYGTPTTQPYLEDELGYVADLEGGETYDPDKARDLLADAGYADGFEFTVPTIPPLQKFAESLAGFWAEIGVTAKVEVVQAGALAEAGRSGNYPVFVTTATVGDPVTWYRYFWGAQSPFNVAFGNMDATLDETTQAGAASIEEDERAEAYAEQFTYAVEEGIFIPVGRIEQVAMHTGEVGHVVWHVNEFFPNPVGITVG